MATSQELTHHKLKAITKDRKTWEIFEEYLAGRKNALVTRLISCQVEDVKNIQGQIQMLNELIRLPDTL